MERAPFSSPVLLVVVEAHPYLIVSPPLSIISICAGGSNVGRSGGSAAFFDEAEAVDGFFFRVGPDEEEGDGCRRFLDFWSSFDLSGDETGFVLAGLLFAVSGLAMVGVLSFQGLWFVRFGRTTRRHKGRSPTTQYESIVTKKFTCQDSVCSNR